MRLRRPLIALALALPFGLLAGLVAAGTASSADALVGQGRQLFVTGCASCHGLDAHGIAGSGPSLVGVGAQAADFYLSTGRMPLAAPGDAPMRKPPAYSQDRHRRARPRTSARSAGRRSRPSASHTDPAAGMRAFTDSAPAATACSRAAAS